MAPDSLNNKKILITGGTSGLGAELVKHFLSEGCSVVATGRNPIRDHISEKLKFYPVDFKNLREVADFGYQIVKQAPFDIVICNAGILSPPSLEMTIDGFESTFQVNFLAHLLLSQILLSERINHHPLVFVTVTSLIIRYIKIKDGLILQPEGYSPTKAYAGSKLNMALLSRFLAEKYQHQGIKSFSFDPGIFNSRIFRTQQKWFHRTYRFASPVLKNPAIVSAKLIRLIESAQHLPGVILNHRGKINEFPVINSEKEKEFWDDWFQKIRPFIRQKG